MRFFCKSRFIRLAMVLVSCIGFSGIQCAAAVSFAGNVVPETGASNVVLEAELPESSSSVNQYKMVDRNIDFEELARSLMGEQSFDTSNSESDLGIYIASGDDGADLMLTSNNLFYSISRNASFISTLLLGSIFNDDEFDGMGGDTDVTQLRSLPEVTEAEASVKELYQLQEEDEELVLVQGGRFSAEALQKFDAEYAEIWGEPLNEITAWDCSEYIGLHYELTKNEIPVMGNLEPDQGMVGDYYNANFSIYIDVLLGDKQVIALKFANWYDFVEPEQVSIISAEEALEIVREKYEDVMLGSGLTVTDIKLEYVPVPDWNSTAIKNTQLLPYWCFTERDQDGNINADRINAITGGDLSYGE